MRDPNNPCLFCNISTNDFELENELAYASYDTYPVSKYHALIVPKRHVENYFELNNEEVLACDALLKELKKNLNIKIIQSKDLMLDQTLVKLQDNQLIIVIFI